MLFFFSTCTASIQPGCFLCISHPGMGLGERCNQWNAVSLSHCFPFHWRQNQTVEKSGYIVRPWNEWFKMRGFCVVRTFRNRAFVNHTRIGTGPGQHIILCNCMISMHSPECPLQSLWYKCTSNKWPSSPARCEQGDLGRELGFSC